MSNSKKEKSGKSKISNTNPIAPVLLTHLTSETFFTSGITERLRTLGVSGFGLPNHGFISF